MLMLSWISTHKRLTLIIFSVIFLLVFSVFFLFQNLKNRFSSPATNTEVAQIEPLAESTGSLKLVSSKSSYKPTEIVDLKAVANSGNKAITAFDVVIEYDPEFFSLTNKQSEKMSEFSYFAKATSSSLRISGVLMENSKDKIFNDEELFDLVFQPKKTGKTQFKLIYTPNATNDSNLITGRGEDLLGKALGVEVEIR